MTTTESAYEASSQATDSISEGGIEPFGENLTWSVLQTTVISLVSILIIFGNVTNLAVLSRSLNDFGITGYFLISLSFADLGECLSGYRNRSRISTFTVVLHTQEWGF